MTSRYFNREVAVNFSSKYKSLFKKRNITFVNQYTTPEQIYPTAEEISNLATLSHIWSLGDRYYKLADEHYNDPSLWWIIAWYNRMPTEAHVKIGWVIDIPLPLEDVLQLWDK